MDSQEIEATRTERLARGGSGIAVVRSSGVVAGYATEMRVAESGYGSKSLLDVPRTPA
jgi:hypothetical protein